MAHLSPTGKGGIAKHRAYRCNSRQGWVRTRRDSKDFSFIELNDGSCLRNLQIIAKNTLPNYAALQRLPTALPLACAERWSLPKVKEQKSQLVKALDVHAPIGEWWGMLLRRLAASSKHPWSST
jgi:aspartyl/asparaginyl-tRNA synthetase